VPIAFASSTTASRRASYRPTAIVTPNASSNARKPTRAACTIQSGSINPGRRCASMPADPDTVARCRWSIDSYELLRILRFATDKSDEYAFGLT
jgi:hypothetical protein